MAKGIALNIGLNRVDPGQYGGWDGTLVACEADANDLNALAKAAGFDATLLLTKDATAKRVVDAIGAAARGLGPGDALLLTYSGHGGQVPDKNGDEPDGQDETWVCFDRQLVDDELYALWAAFKPGVRIAMLSDSCHSGSVARQAAYDAIHASGAITGPIGDVAELPDSATPRTRALPADVGQRVYAQHRALYDGIQATHPDGDKVAIGASLILISGCQDNQLSSDGDKNGLFTGTLLKTWNQGKFKGGYRPFYRRILRRMPPWQSPNYFTVGAPNPSFEAQTPFTV